MTRAASTERGAKTGVRRPNIMLLIMTGLTLVAIAVAYHQGALTAGFKETGRLLVQVAPVLLPAFVLAGMVSVLVSAEAMMGWLGAESGLRGLMIGTLAGAITPGGPFLAFPLLAVLLKQGAGVGAVSAYLTSWALLGVHRVLAFEIPILGLRFVIVRVLASLLMPVLVGWIAQALWARFGAL